MTSINPTPPLAHRAHCQEVRLAVVMYGGTSLAIYMNGVAQEILRLVRATAVAPDPNPWKRAPLLAEPQGTEQVYRRLGQVLRRHAPPATDTPDDPRAPIHSSVVVDVVSGTSAGGINGVFLAKALATDTTLDSLRDLWMEEAAIERLVNDAGSLEDAPGLDQPDPPRSLLNSRRMHLRLVEALDGMDPPGGPAKPPSPYVDQLDLFVTATDLHGTALPMRLADGVVWERRHRNVFHFRYDWDPAFDRKRDPPANDFDAGGGHAERNHRLAFAARATSSYPFAFEPMTLDQAVDAEDPKWADFFRDRLSPKVPPEREGWALPEMRAFGDGGLLDNKPFSYAIDRVVSRLDEGVLPIDRKLLYVEPSPQRPEDDAPPERPPDALEHVALALGTLPRHETIREDLQRILDRNRLAKWVDRILERMEEDVLHVPKGEVPDRAAFADKGLAEMVREKGVVYGSYQRLKVYALTDELAAMLAAVGGLRRDSEEYQAIRELVYRWRTARYVEYRSEIEGDQATHNRFLVDYEIPFRIRRLRFVLKKADALLRLDEETTRTLEAAEETWRPRTDDDRRAFSDAVLEAKRHARRALRTLLETRQRLCGRGGIPSTSDERHPLEEAVRDAGIDFGTIRPILDAGTPEEREAAIDRAHAAHREGIERVMERLQDYIETAADAASQICKTNLRPEEDDPTSAAGRAARSCLWTFYSRFESYDMILLPILHASGLGEERDRVDVIRVSPQEAPSLIDERADVRRRRKLAGTALFNFGAFLDRGWRRNDFLWGRLDGAERLIGSVLPGETNRAVREELIERAHRHIIREEITGADQAEVCRTLVRATLASPTDVPNEEAVRSLLGASEDGVTHPALETVLRRALTDQQLRAFFRESYEVDRNVDRATTMRVASRASRVIGRMFEDIAGTRGQGSAASTWFARVAQAFWAVVEVAVPGSFASLLFQHALKVVYAFEAFLFAAGLLLGNPEVQRFGLLAFVATLGVHVTALVLGDFMARRGRFVVRAVLVAVGLAVLAYAAYGVVVAFAPEALPAWASERGWLPLAVAGGLIGLVALSRLYLAWVPHRLRHFWHRARGLDEAQRADVM